MLNYQEIKSMFESKEQSNPTSINESLDDANKREAEHATLFAAHHHFQHSHEIAANTMANIGDSKSEMHHRNMAEIHGEHMDQHQQAMDHLNRYSDAARVHGKGDTAAKAHHAAAMAKSNEAMESSKKRGMHLSGNTLNHPHGTVALKSGAKLDYRHNVHKMMDEISKNTKPHKG